VRSGMNGVRTATPAPRDFPPRAPLGGAWIDHPRVRCRASRIRLSDDGRAQTNRARIIERLPRGWSVVGDEVALSLHRGVEGR